jgi:hypothetical protein
MLGKSNEKKKMAPWSNGRSRTVYQGYPKILSLMSRESFLHDTMNDFFESKEMKNQGGNPQNEKARSGSTRIQKRRSSSKKSSSVDAGTGAASKSGKREIIKRGRKKS